jgi:serine/arginine repetitive matrix protein 2
MLGGGHVRRRSVASVIDASPCVRFEKRKNSAFEGPPQKELPALPKEACIVEKPSIASSYKFGGERMIRAQRGLYERQSLEDNCLVGDGEDLSISRVYFLRFLGIWR